MLIFWLSILTIPYIYAIYSFMLKSINSYVKQKGGNSTGSKSIKYSPRATILIPAYNEEINIARRIENLLASDYPIDEIEIIVASDGSTDQTVTIAKMFDDKGVRVLDFNKNRGRASVQNDGVREATGDIVIFTDAETEFDKSFVKNLVRYFSSEETGCVVGNLVYKTKDTSISSSEGLYWKFEKEIRQLESNLGILATATGACMAVRRELWKDLTPTDDSDFTTPLDVIMQGRRVVYAPEAIAYDVPPASVSGELKARIRQTSKNLVGTLKRWGWRGWIQHPFVSWGLLSHKILRWLTPFFMIGAFLSNLFLLDEGLIYQAAFVAQIAFYILALVGLGGELLKMRLPVVSSVFSFCIANIGMGLGVIRGIIGKAPAAYKTTE